MKTHYESKNGRKFLCFAHVVITTKYRRHVINQVALSLLRKSFLRTALSMGFAIEEIEVEPDHVHLLLRYPPTLALSTMVGRLKGSASHAVRRLRLPAILHKLWGKAFWTPAYFVVSCGGAPIDILRRYIQQQAGPLTTS